MPAELDELTRRLTRLEIEEAALVDEKSAASRERLADLRKELADLRFEVDALRTQWEAERRALHRVQELRQEIEQARRQADEAERAYDLNGAAQLRHGKLPELERRLEAEESHLTTKQGSRRLLREVVTEEEIAMVISRWTGIPVSRLAESERDKLRDSTKPFMNGWWVRTKLCSWCRTPSCAAEPGLATPSAQWARSSSWARPESARPSWPGHSLPHCSTPRTTWSEST